MKTTRVWILRALALGLCAWGAVQAAAKEETPSRASAPAAAKGKPRIHIIATGGTIAGAQASQTEYGYKSGAFQVEDLIAAVPTMKDIATLSGEQLVNIGSQDMSDAIWLKLAKRVNEVLKSGEVDGVVITHGTDTMEETAFFLNLVVSSDKPVVLVGSMRPATAVGAEGPANLYNAVAVAASPGAAKRGVLVVMNDEIHGAREVEKTNTTNVQTFASERGAQGLAHTGKITWFEPSAKRHTVRSEFRVDDLASLPEVDVLYAHANMPADLIDAAVRGGAKGLVIAGVGDGNMTKEALQALERAAKQNQVVVVRSTRLPTGMVLRNNEVDDDKMGFVASGEFNPAKSRVLLQLALTRTRDPRKIQEIFNTY